MKYSLYLENSHDKMKLIKQYYINSSLIKYLFYQISCVYHFYHFRGGNRCEYTVQKNDTNIT